MILKESLKVTKTAVWHYFKPKGQQGTISHAGSKTNLLQYLSMLSMSMLLTCTEPGSAPGQNCADLEAAVCWVNWD